MRRFAGVFALVLACGGVQADTKGEEDGIVVNRLNESDFEVVQGTNFGAAEYWCGAATFIERRSNRTELTEIFVKRPLAASPTTPGRRSVVFTTDPAGLDVQRGLLTVTVKQAGVALKSSQGRRFCRDAFTRSTK